MIKCILISVLYHTCVDSIKKRFDCGFIYSIVLCNGNGKIKNNQLRLKSMLSTFWKTVLDSFVTIRS